MHATPWERLKGLLFHCFPHHYLSRLTFWFTRQRWSAQPWLLRIFIRTFNVDMSEAERSRPEEFTSFNDFFTRRLRPGVRLIDSNERAIVSPCDGTVSQCGSISLNSLIQAKGQYYSLDQLLANQDDLIEHFHSGKFCTVYLSPRDYHSVHMATSGTLKNMLYIPGRLFSVAHYAPRAIPRLYARNERVVSVFGIKGGWMCSIMVGALNVAAIEMAWHGLVTPPHKKHMQRYDYTDPVAVPVLAKGDLMGTFNMGSTVILLFSPGSIRWLPDLHPQQQVRMGQVIGYTH